MSDVRASHPLAPSASGVTSGLQPRPPSEAPRGLRPPSVVTTSLQDVPSPIAERASEERTRSRKRALAVLALVALGAVVWIALPLAVGIFLGALLAFTLQPAYRRLRRNMATGPAALTCTLGATALVTTAAGVMATLLVTRTLRFLSGAPTLWADGGPLRSLEASLGAKAAVLHIDAPGISEKLRTELMNLGSRLAGIAAQVASMTMSAMLTLFFMAMTTYFVLRHWTTIVLRAEELLPFEPRDTHALLERFRVVGRQVLLGTVVTGGLQGLMSAFGYWLTGVPQPAFFGALTALASLVPGIGTALVWGTVGAVLIMTGHVGAGLLELTFGLVFLVIVADYVIRPRLVGSEGGVPSLLMFIALFGGVEVFGIVGLILGPVIVMLSIAVLQTYARDVAREGAAPPAG